MIAGGRGVVSSKFGARGGDLIGMLPSLELVHAFKMPHPPCNRLANRVATQERAIQIEGNQRNLRCHRRESPSWYPRHAITWVQGLVGRSVSPLQYHRVMTHGTDQPPTLICLIGPPAVGKTTVGQSLCRMTGFHLFHGHVVGDVLSPYFPFGTPSFARLTDAWRRHIIEEALTAGQDVVTTVAWRFDVPADMETIWNWLEPYQTGGRVRCVELVAPLAVRMERNRSEQRWRHKNPYWVTDTYLRHTDATHRYDSGGAFPFDVPHLRLETTHLSPEETADRIVEQFDLPRLQGFSSKQ